MASDIDGAARTVANEEAANAPRLAAHAPDDLKALSLGALVRCVDVGHSDGDVDTELLGIDRGWAWPSDVNWVAGVLLEANMSIPSSSIATRNPRNPS